MLLKYEKDWAAVGSDLTDLETPLVKIKICTTKDDDAYIETMIVTTPYVAMRARRPRSV